MDTKKNTNKIAVPSMGKSPDALMSESFGRCPFIIIYDNESRTYNSFENMGAKVQDGSGLRAAEILIQNKVNRLLTVEIGRKAYSVLSNEHIAINILKSTGKVKSLINKFLKKEQKINRLNNH